MFLLPFLVLKTMGFTKSRTQNLYRDTLRLGCKGGSTTVENTEPKTMNFSKIQGRLEMLFIIDLLGNLFYLCYGTNLSNIKTKTKIKNYY